MRVKKIALIVMILAGMIFPAVSFGADSVTLHVMDISKPVIASPDLVKPYVPPVYSDDGSIETPEEKGEYTFPAVSGTNYRFTSVTNALDFALDAEDFIKTNYGSFNTASYDYSYDPELTEIPNNPVEVSVRKSTISSTETITAKYSDIAEITITTTATGLTSPSGERHFILRSGSQVTFSGITFRPNSDGTGGGVEVRSGTAIFEDDVFDSCVTSDNGGGILVSGGTATITGCTFTGCQANYGGGLALTTGRRATLRATTFTGNTAENYGGAVYTSSSLEVSTDVNFNIASDPLANTADMGGAIYIAENATANINGANVRFYDNEANSGGAVYLASRATVNVSGSGVSFTANVASNDGGAIYASANATVSITGDAPEILENRAVSGSGGAIYLGSAASFALRSSSPKLNENQATSGNGGAIYAAGRNTITIANSATFDSNTANNGGAVYMAQGTTATNLNITGDNAVTFSNNEANVSGGAIYAEQNANISFNPEVTFSLNKAQAGDGGAIWVAVPSQLPSGTVYFTDNNAGKDNTTTTECNGGAICIGGQTASSITLGSSYKYSFSGNEAKNYGGAICTYSSDVTFDSYNVSVKNTAGVGGGFAASKNAKITIRNSSFDNQVSNGSGGVVWALNAEADSSNFGVNGANLSNGTESHQGGGAIYSNGELTVTSSFFTLNEAAQGGGALYSNTGDLSITDTRFTQNKSTQGGGAVYAEGSTVAVTNSYFANNQTSSGNGGAVVLEGYCSSMVTSSTFRGNVSSKLDGGAVYAQGTIDIRLCYFRDNKSQRSGGAIYFNQNNDDPSRYSTFRMTSSMLEENTTDGAEGNGGGLFVVANNAVLTSNTFSGNRLSLAGNSGTGGGAYVSAIPIQDENLEIVNCTFYNNHIDDASSSGTGGGGLAVYCEKTTIIRSCTFALNGSPSGGAIYIGDGSKVQLSGTMAVGNTDEGTYDIWSDGTISSGGYNRIGVYGKGSGITDFYSETRNDSDRTSYPAKGWTKATFFSNNVLADNERTDLGSNIPPYIGTTLASRVRLQTLMLSEDSTLPLVDRATNSIPYTRRGMFPTTDERGVARVTQGSQINLDIGACFFDGTRPSGGESPVASYTISRVEIGGIPNNLRRVGQTASLVAKIYYSNGRTALGGTGTDEEPITWTSDKPNIIKINASTGDIVVLSYTPGNTYVTIKATTVRTNLSGAQVSDTKYIRVTEPDYSNLNTSPQVMRYLSSYATDIAESDIAFNLSDQVTTSTISDSSFQSSFSAAYNGVTASMSDLLNSSENPFKTVSSYSSSDGFTAAKSSTLVSFEGLSKGYILPVTYQWDFNGGDLIDLLGYDMTGKTPDESTLNEIFSVLRLDFEGTSTKIPVIGPGALSAGEAMSAGVLEAWTFDEGSGLSVAVNACIANVSTSSGVSSTANDGPQIIKSGSTNLLVVPDGNGDDGKIYGTLWLAKKSGTDNSDKSSNSDQKSGTSSGGGGGGGGCNGFVSILTALAVTFILKRR